MSWSERSESEPRTFSLHEANSLIPTLERELVRVKGCQRTLRAIQGDIRRASHAAEFGGGSVAGALYVDTLEQMSNSLRILQKPASSLKTSTEGSATFRIASAQNRLIVLATGRGNRRMVARPQYRLSRTPAYRPPSGITSHAAQRGGIRAR